MIMNRVRRGRGRSGTVILTTIGAKSGAERRSPLRGFPLDGGGWLVVASAGGAPGNPGWYHNLAAHPDRAAIETTGDPVAVAAEHLHGADRDEAWRRITSEAPQFATYQKKTDREIPVIRLTPR